MDLQITDEQRAIQEALQDFAANEIRPAARECEEAGQPSERVTKQLFEMGVAAPVPEEFGGQGTFDAVTSVLIAEEIAWGDPGVAYGVLAPGLASTIIDLAGTDEQRAELLPRVLEGAQGSLALAERDAGADLSQIEASAELSGDVARLSGTKYAVPYADVAQIRLAVTRVDGALAIWLIPADAELIAKPEDKLGLRSSKTYKVELDGLEIPSGAILGGEDADQTKIKSALLRAKLLNAGIAIGLGRAAIEYATKYAQERTAFGRPIGAFQAISFKIADRAMDVESARLFVWEAAWAVDQGRDDAERFVMEACGHAVAAAVAAADDGVQILGGHGYMKDHPEEMWYRDAMTLATFDSPSQIGDIFLGQVYRQEAAR